MSMVSGRPGAWCPRTPRATPSASAGDGRADGALSGGLARLLEVLAVPSAADPHARGWEPFSAALEVEARGTRVGCWATGAEPIRWTRGAGDMPRGAGGAGGPRLSGRGRRPALPRRGPLGGLDHASELGGGGGADAGPCRSGASRAAEARGGVGNRARLRDERDGGAPGQRDPLALVRGSGRAVPALRRAGAARGAGLALSQGVAVPGRDRRAKDGHLSSLDGGGHSGQPRRGPAVAMPAGFGTAGLVAHGSAGLRAKGQRPAAAAGWPRPITARRIGRSQHPPRLDNASGAAQPSG